MMAQLGSQLLSALVVNNTLYFCCIHILFSGYGYSCNHVTFLSF